MNVWAVMMVKDEADVVGGVIRHVASEGFTGIAILNNGSTDGTLAAIDEATNDVAGPRKNFTVLVHDDPEIGYYQSRKITALVDELARTRPFDWVVPVDADEIWHADVPLDEFFAKVDNEWGANIVGAGLLSHFATAGDNRALVNPFERFAWRQPDIAPLPKVAFRWEPGAVIHQGAHGVTLTGRDASRPPSILERSELTVRHFPYRSVEQFIRKARNGAAAYAATDLPPDMGNHWRRYGTMTDAELTDTYVHDFYFMRPEHEGLVIDPAPFCRWSR